MQAKLKRRSVLGFLAGLASIVMSAGLLSGASAQDVDTTAAISAAPHKATRHTKVAVHAPRRGSSKGAGQPFIEFRSRYALTYGHTFVVFGRLNARGQVGEIKPEMVAGLHPAGESSVPWTVGHVTPVPAETGWSDGDLEEEYVSNRFRLVLSEAEYAKLVPYIRQKQASSPMWHAALYNCNLWTGEIAEHLGLKTGFHWLPPAEFIGEIKKMNSGDPRVAATPPEPGARTASLPSGQSQAASASPTPAGPTPALSWSDASFRLG
jgi:hypothetical protein